MQIDGQLGFGSGCNGDNNPYYITFDGGSNLDFVIGDRTHEGGIDFCGGTAGNAVDHITFNHMKIGSNMVTTGGPTISAKSANNLKITNSVIGPACCGNPGGTSQDMTLSVGSVGDVNPTNVVVDHNTWYGNQRYCSAWNQAYSSQLSSCPGSDCPPDSCHGDCIHSFGNENIAITNNQFWDCDTQGIYLPKISTGEQKKAVL